MTIDKETVIKRIDELIMLAKKSGNTFYGEGEVTSGTISILATVYGAESEKCKAYVEQYRSYANNINKRLNLPQIVGSSIGTLHSIKAEIKSGLVGNITAQAQAGIFGDFITLARHAFDESKDVASVLISAALEDTLKRYAVQNGLDVAEADMPEVINAPKSKGLLKGPQASVVQSYVQLRNKAFHAEWDKIDKETVNSAITFTETFLLEHFS
jgi:hypothetical protein